MICCVLVGLWNLVTANEYVISVRMSIHIFTFGINRPNTCIVQYRRVNSLSDEFAMVEERRGDSAAVAGESGAGGLRRVAGGGLTHWADCDRLCLAMALSRAIAPD